MFYGWFKLMHGVLGAAQVGGIILLLDLGLTSLLYAEGFLHLAVVDGRWQRVGTGVVGKI